MQSNWFNSRQRESGNRYKVTAIMQADGSAYHNDIIRNLKIELSHKWGGFSSNATQGGWVDDTGKLMEEDNITFNVSFTDIEDIDKARGVFTVAGLLLSQDWIHIECSQFDAGHTKAIS
tara:strand:+ start:83 stop:439 length:357 start_codon:yes stop_codon:yes gene_type:complete